MEEMNEGWKRGAKEDDENNLKRRRGEDVRKGKGEKKGTEDSSKNGKGEQRRLTRITRRGKEEAKMCQREKDKKRNGGK